MVRRQIPRNLSGVDPEGAPDNVNDGQWRTQGELTLPTA